MIYQNRNRLIATMLLSGPPRSSFIERFFRQNARYETKSFTKPVNKYLMKFEKEIDGYFSCLGKDGFGYIKNPFTTNVQRLQIETVFKSNWLNFNMMVLHSVCILRNSYVSFWFMIFNSYKKLLHLLFKHCFYFPHQRYLTRHF